MLFLVNSYDARLCQLAWNIATDITRSMLLSDGRHLPFSTATAYLGSGTWPGLLVGQSVKGVCGCQRHLCSLYVR